ncbi:hypothetical protein OGATHE_003536 [Ogataea polymorpha]|uniref:Uncharacterized protein n=1 Tax=Ogataea polymorpha TaxID=460523 RepID=A0A9P8P456_9ASCO|nr:hypothetical protein OGATHE_003536 [Ogataea polymorpha]
MAFGSELEGAEPDGAAAVPLETGCAAGGGGGETILAEPEPEAGEGVFFARLARACSTEVGSLDDDDDEEAEGAGGSTVGSTANLTLFLGGVPGGVVVRKYLSLMDEIIFLSKVSPLSQISTSLPIFSLISSLETGTASSTRFSINDWILYTAELAVPSGEDSVISVVSDLEIWSIRPLTIASTTYRAPNLCVAGVALQHEYSLDTSLDSSDTLLRNISFSFLILDPDTPGAFSPGNSFNIVSNSSTDIGLLANLESMVSLFDNFTMFQNILSKSRFASKFRGVETLLKNLSKVYFVIILINLKNLIVKLIKLNKLTRIVELEAEMLSRNGKNVLLPEAASQEREKLVFLYTEKFRTYLELIGYANELVLDLTLVYSKIRLPKLVERLVSLVSWIIGVYRLSKDEAEEARTEKQIAAMQKHRASAGLGWGSTTSIMGPGSPMTSSVKVWSSKSRVDSLACAYSWRPKTSSVVFSMMEAFCGVDLKDSSDDLRRWWNLDDRVLNNEFDLLWASILFSVTGSSSLATLWFDIEAVLRIGDRDLDTPRKAEEGEEEDEEEDGAIRQGLRPNLSESAVAELDGVDAAWTLGVFTFARPLCCELLELCELSELDEQLSFSSTPAGKGVPLPELVDDSSELWVGILVSSCSESSKSSSVISSAMATSFFFGEHSSECLGMWKLSNSGADMVLLLFLAGARELMNTSSRSIIARGTLEPDSNLVSSVIKYRVRASSCADAGVEVNKIFCLLDNVESSAASWTSGLFRGELPNVPESEHEVDPGTDLDIMGGKSPNSWTSKSPEIAAERRCRWPRLGGGWRPFCGPVGDGGELMDGP